MKTLFAFVSMAAVVAYAAPPYVPVNRPDDRSRASMVRDKAATAAAAAAENTAARKVTVYLVRAELTVDAKGWAKSVTLLNPTPDEWSNRALKRELRRRRFLPAAGSDEPVAGSFVVTTRVEIRG